MYQKSRRFQTKIITYAVLVIFSLLVIGVFVYSYVSKYQENKLDIKSRYTFSIRIDDQWNVVSDDYVLIMIMIMCLILLIRIWWGLELNGSKNISHSTDRNMFHIQVYCKIRY